MRDKALTKKSYMCFISVRTYMYTREQSHPRVRRVSLIFIHCEPNALPSCHCAVVPSRPPTPQPSLPPPPPHQNVV